MNEKQNEIKMPEELKEEVTKLLKKYDRQTPNFFEEGQSEVIYVPIRDGQLKVYHHTPKNCKSKRPILFMPGLFAAPIAWIDFHRSHHDVCEYYYVETREKASSRIKRNCKIRLTMVENAHDLQKVIQELGLEDRDYVLFTSSYGGGSVLYALINKLIHPPTVITFDPIVKWVYTSRIENFLLAILPPAVLSVFRSLILYVQQKDMTNERQILRMRQFAKGTTPWKFRNCLFHNRKFNIYADLEKIDQELLLFHGPLDKYHFRSEYIDYATKIPKGRFVFMDCEDEQREFLAGVIATEFAMIRKEDGIPESLQKFEISLER